MIKIILTGFIIFFISANINAQTGGPGQPEFMQFQQAGISDLVNPSTGTFSYQIPLYTIGGYPMNLTYQSGIQMEDVATMVGLGWNLNAGSIVRTLRVIPDDFSNDELVKEFSIKPNETKGFKLGVDLEISGVPKKLKKYKLDSLNASLGGDFGIFENSYNGWGVERSLKGSFNAFFLANSKICPNLNLSMGASANSQTGVERFLSLTGGCSIGKSTDKYRLSSSLGKSWSVNSTEGQKSSFNVNLTYTRHFDHNYTTKDEKGNTTERTSRIDATVPLNYTKRSYLNNSFQPDINYPFEFSSGTLSGTVGWDIKYVDPNIRVTGYFTRQALSTNSKTYPMIGMMYENENNDKTSLRDFQRDKSGLPYYFSESKVLPVPYKAPDIFNLNVQGLSMSFSVSKNDVGIMGDAYIRTDSRGEQDGREANFGSSVKVGLNLGFNKGHKLIERWIPESLSSIKFIGQILEKSNGKLIRPFSFRNHGEKNRSEHSFFIDLGGFSPVKFDVADEKSINGYLSNGVWIGGNIYNKVPPVRQTDINYLTALEASIMGFDKEIKYYSFENSSIKTLKRDGDYRKKHHLSEINVTQPDGMKYIFGIPVYNREQKEVVFNVGKNPDVTCSENVVNYETGVNSTNNKKGVDYFFESTKTPAYVTQFLITAVLSPDYRDLTNDGISNDDLGNYVLFNYYKEEYGKSNPEEQLYFWRTPYGEKTATYNQAMRSDLEDDKGNYVFGKKELWYVHSVESKTEVAKYHYSIRKDGYGVVDEDGGKDEKKYLRQLDSITIYSKPDLELRSTSAIPLKTVHLYYDNSLCRKIKNSKNDNVGKLTLTKVSFTHERSRKGILEPYTFLYDHSIKGVGNPDYDVRSVNRWGYYQRNLYQRNLSLSDCNNTGGLSNIDFPYSSQMKSEMDKNAYAWNLTKINIPGGGAIDISYEANDYAYVQNKRAGQMFNISGIGSNSGFNLYEDKVRYDRIYFKLNSPVSSKEELHQKYIQDIFGGYLYYKFYVKLRKSIDGRDRYEYISGYATIDDYGISPLDPYYGYVDLTPVVRDDDKEKNGNCNPILKNALQWMRINRNRLLFDKDPVPFEFQNKKMAEQVKNAYSEMNEQIKAFKNGVNDYSMGRGFCKEVDLDKSFIRLYNPDKRKISGGSRVSEISINDMFGSMTFGTQENKSYTTNYSYTVSDTDIVTGTISDISSGVADYEPMIGGDEISLKQPVYYKDIKKKAPDNEYFVEEPLNESLYPAPNIIYSEVTQITNKPKKLEEQDVSKTGKIVNKFFTAKDYPVLAARTEVDEERDKSKFEEILPLHHDYATVSQGYSIILNDMSGVPKSTEVYNENGDKISGEVMEYFTDNNSFTTIDRLGTINRNVQMGISTDYTIDCRRSYDVSRTGGLNTNLNVVETPPGITFAPLPSYTEEKNQFQSVVFNKEIQINGILKRKTVFDQTSSVITENLAFDEVTGEALLTKTTNEFSDTLYSFKYPAYWMYPGMGPSNENSKLRISSSKYEYDDFSRFLKYGDELRGMNGRRLWYKGGNITLTDNVNFQVYNSGAKNLLSQGAGHVVTWNSNPLNYGNKIKFDKASILNSNAVQYSDAAILNCESCPEIADSIKKNVFLSGQRGTWKPLCTWFNLKDRTSGDLASGITNIRTDGLFESYDDFWDVQTGSEWKMNPLKWEWKEKVNLTNVDGNTLETEDRISRKNASLFGFKNILTIAQVSNSSYSEAHYDGFEDYNFSYCADTLEANILNRVKLKNGQVRITSKESHTGRYSFNVGSGVTFTGTPVCGDSIDCFCIEGFSPVSNKKYLFSCWVMVEKPKPILSCNDASVVISGIQGPSVTLKPEGPVIENWQRVAGTFTSSGSGIQITLNKSTDLKATATYYDDIRIFPADGNMVSYVYDNLDLKLTNILDENNYFTKYEYDNNKELIRVKKETEIGIITVQEGYKSLIKYRPTYVPPN